VEKIFVSLASISEKVARVALAGAVILGLASVFGRIAKLPVPGTYEYVGAFTGLLVCLGIAHCQVKKGHVFATFVVEKFSKRTQAIIETIIFFVSLILFLICAYATYENGVLALETSRRLGTTPLLVAPFIFLQSLGFLALALVLIFDAINALKKLLRQGENIESA
jgi:TRAP-type C4-dicarboxylate transport system permease small subunit